jgi:hypothetical protein
MHNLFYYFSFRSLFLFLFLLLVFNISLTPFCHVIDKGLLLFLQPSTSLLVALFFVEISMILTSEQSKGSFFIGIGNGPIEVFFTNLAIFKSPASLSLSLIFQALLLLAHCFIVANLVWENIDETSFLSVLGFIVLEAKTLCPSTLFPCACNISLTPILSCHG